MTSSRDFRSDTTTTPTAEMYKYMMEASVGDDVFDEDATTHALQHRVAEMAGKEAALFVASGTMGNQLCIRTHLQQPPYSVACDYRAHVLNWEGGALAFHTGATILAIRPENGFLNVHDLEKVVDLPDENGDIDPHHCPTRLVTLENTMDGAIFPFEQMKMVSKWCRDRKLALHLDGARLWNASVETGTPIKDYCQLVDSVSLCFSKGLGAPIGSVIVGSNAFIRKARHFRKMYGGAWRQSGPLSAACLYSLDNILPKMHLDHAAATLLAKECQALGIVISKPVDTNMVWAEMSAVGVKDITKLIEHLKENGFKAIGGYGPTKTEMRFVVHHQNRDSVLELAGALKNYLK